MIQPKYTFTKLLQNTTTSNCVGHREKAPLSPYSHNNISNYIIIHCKKCKVFTPCIRTPKSLHFTAAYGHENTLMLSSVMHFILHFQGVYHEPLGNPYDLYN